MSNPHNRPKPAKKISRGKKPRWYFRLRGANRNAVLESINDSCKIWKYAGKGNTRDIRKIKLAKLNQVNFLPLDTAFDRSLFDMLGALDIFILSKWLQNGTIRLDGEFETIWRICAFDAPLIKSDDPDEIYFYHYLCLERDRDHPWIWRLQVRSRSYLSENTLDHPYNLAGLPKT